MIAFFARVVAAYVFLYLTMLRTLLILPFCLWLTTASAVNLDSLWGVWNDKSQPDTNRLKAIGDIAWDGYLFSQPDSAFYFAQLQYNLAETSGNKYSMTVALNTQGVSFAIRGELDKAIEYFTRSLKIEEELGNKKGIAYSLNNIGVIYREQGDYAKAIDYYTRSLKIKEELGDKKGIAATLNNIGNIYQYQGDYVKAIEYHTRSLKIKEERGDKKGIANSLNNIGLIYNKQGNYAKSMGYFTRSLKISEELGDKKGIAISLNNIGNIYQYQGETTKAIDYYTRSLNLREEIGHKEGIANSLNNIGNTYGIKGDYAKALEKCTKALSLAQEIGNVEIIKGASNSLWETYKKLGKHQQALDMHELYIQMRDSILSIENKEAIIQQGFKYEYEKQAAVDSVANAKERAIKEETIKRQQVELSSEKKMRNTLFGGLGIISLLLIFAINRFLITRKQKDTIAEQKKVVEEQKELVEEQKKDITDSIQYAENIQRALLPSTVQLSLLPEYFVLFHPKDIVSGDFYWMQHHNNSVYLAACDCTGHGVPGAFMSMIGSSQLDEAVVEKGLTQPNEIFYEVRKGIVNALKQTGEAGQQKDGMDATLIAWNKNNKLQFSVANNPLFLIRNGTLLETKPDRQPVGFYTGEQKPFTHHDLTLEKGDTAYIFSDGYHDQFDGPKDKKFMMKNFKKLLLSIQDKSMNEQKTILEETMAQWKGDTEQVDDILVIGVRF